MRNGLRCWGLFASALYASCNVYDPSLLPGAGALGGAAGDSRAGNEGLAGVPASSGGAGSGAGGLGGSPFPSNGAGGGDGATAGTSPGSGNNGGGGTGSVDDGGASAGGEGGVPGAAGGAGGGGGDGGEPTVSTPGELALGKSALASSTQTNNDPFKGNDGDVATRWCASQGVFPQWWRVDLGQAHALQSFSVRFEYYNRTYSYVIETSPDDVTYTAVPGTTATDAVGAVQSGVFPSGTSARYVRITITNAGPDENPKLTWASFYEFSLIGW